MYAPVPLSHLFPSPRQPPACSYAQSATPVLGYAGPASGPAGAAVTLLGRQLANVTEARFLDASGALAGSSAVTPAAAPQLPSDPGAPPGPVEAVSCVVPPSLAVGTYAVQLVRSDGGLSVDPYRGASYAVLPPAVQALTPSAVPLRGGVPLTLTLAARLSLPLAGNGTSAAAANCTSCNHTSSNAGGVAVAIGAGVLGPTGLPCPVTSYGFADAGRTNVTNVTCAAPSLAGWVLAEFWALPIGGVVSTPTPLGIRPLVDLASTNPSEVTERCIGSITSHEAPKCCKARLTLLARPA